MNGKRLLVLAATPLQTVELKTIFSNQQGSIRRRLEHPPKLRDAGWDLPTQSQTEFVQGELIRVMEHRRMIVDLYRDGTFILGAQIHRDFLAWSDTSDLRLHPLALIELTVNFLRFYQLVLDDFRTPAEIIEFQIGLRHMHLESQKNRLGSGPVGQFFPTGTGGSDAPADNWTEAITAPSKNFNPDLVAFRLIRELYLWFGHFEEAIPYTMDTPDGKVIDAKQISALR